jgi:hypothetical protein
VPVGGQPCGSAWQRALSMPSRRVWRLGRLAVTLFSPRAEAGESVERWHWAWARQSVHRVHAGVDGDFEVGILRAAQRRPGADRGQHRFSARR